MPQRLISSESLVWINVEEIPYKVKTAGLWNRRYGILQSHSCASTKRVSVSVTQNRKIAQQQLSGYPDHSILKGISTKENYNKKLFEFCREFDLSHTFGYRNTRLLILTISSITATGALAILSSQTVISVLLYELYALNSTQSRVLHDVDLSPS